MHFRDIVPEILTPYSNNNNTQLNINSFTHRINQKISILGKKIFSYLYRNKHAFVAGLWSYLVIEAGMVACQMTLGDKYINDINSCQKLLCDQWSTYNGTLHVFPHNIASHCNSSSNSKNFITYSFEACMNDLCEYMNSVGERIYECMAIFTQNSTEKNFDNPSKGSPYSSKLVHQLWEHVCPKKQFQKQNINEEAAYLNDCLEKLCEQSVQLNIKLDGTVINWCQNINVNKLHRALSNLTKIVYDSKQQAKDSETWIKANVIASLIASLTAIVASIATILTTLAAIKTPTALLSVNLNNLVNSASQTADTVVQMSHLAGDEIIPQETLNTISELTDSLSYHSARSMEDLTMDLPQINIIPSEEDLLNNVKLEILGVKPESILAAGGSLLASVGIIGFEQRDKGGIVINDEAIAEIPKTTHFISKIIRSTLSMNGVSSTENPHISTEKITSFSEQEITINDIFQQYLDDYIVNYFNVRDIISRQVSRLKDSLESWQNALCFYSFPNHIACQFPLPNSNSLLGIPIEKLKDMFSEDPIGLCYIFQEQLWCNWYKFLDIVSYTRSISINFFNCYSDQFFLSGKKLTENLYQIRFQGEFNNCYNETTLIRI